MYTYLTDMKNSQVLSLAYVIFKTPSPSNIFIEREREIIKNAPLQGKFPPCDTNTVLVILK